jgi:hypothetical protein
MVVKGPERDDAMLIGFWFGQTTGKPGYLQAIHYDLRPSLWGEVGSFVDSYVV